MATDQLQAAIKQVQGLSLEEQLELSKYLADRLAESRPKSEPRYLVYGEFRNSGKAECPRKKISKLLNGIRQKKI
jgi:hypothetical protein